MRFEVGYERCAWFFLYIRPMAGLLKRLYFVRRSVPLPFRSDLASLWIRYGTDISDALVFFRENRFSSRSLRDRVPFVNLGDLSRGDGAIYGTSTNLANATAQTPGPIWVIFGLKVSCENTNEGTVAISTLKSSEYFRVLCFQRFLWWNARLLRARMDFANLPNASVKSL